MNRKLYVLLVDDEPLARHRLRNLLAAHPEVEVVGEAGRLSEARRVLSATSVDLVLLDIDLFGEDGFALLPDLSPGTRVTFVTAHDEYAIKAFECQAIDYLLKPVEAHRLARSLARLRLEGGASVGEGDMSPLADRIPLRDRGRIFLVPKREIIAIFAEREYTRIVTETFAPLMLRKAMLRWEEELASDAFLRVHRHTLINLAHLVSLQEADGQLSARLNGYSPLVPVSSRLAPRLKAHLQAKG